MIERSVVKNINKYIKTDDIIVLHGARQVGKTTIMKMLYEKIKTPKYYFDLEDSRFLSICNNGIEEIISFLQQKGIIKNQKDNCYIFIDEVQYLSNPSSLLKITYDHYKNIKLIVSGSSSFNIKKKFKDSLVGRTVDFEIFPLNFEEFLIFKEQKTDLTKEITNELIIKNLTSLYKEFVLYGGYPKIVLTNEIEKKETYLQQIIDTYINKDIRDLANVKYIDRFNKLVQVLATQSGNLLNVDELSNTTKLARQTIEEYLFILEATYIIKLVPPYHNNIRSELFKMPKVFFYDTGILSMLWLKMLAKELIGNIFETSVFSELLKKYKKENVYFWRTQSKKEIDFIIKDKQKIVPIETKINNLSFSKNSVNYFLENYKLSKSYCISITGDNADTEKTKFIFPWNIYNLKF
jgi:hypothetical protein